MRALRWHGRRDLRLEDVPAPGPPAAGEVRIAVEWCGICGTDVEEYTDGPLVIPSSPHPLTGLCAPMIVGHEVSGRVSEAGPGVDLAPGTLVALDGYLYCGRCRACQRHQTNLCERWAHIGMSYPGGLAEAMLVPAAMAVPATDEIPSDQLALAEPCSVAVRAMRRARLQIGERIAVIGAGTIGLAVLQVARTAGAGEAFVVDPIPARRGRARQLGGDGVAASVEELVGGDMAGAFDLVVDCSGSSAVPNDAIDLCRPGGRIALVGFPPRPGMLDYTRLLLKELSLVASVGHVYDEDFAAAVRLLCSGRVEAEPLISDRIPLERSIRDGIERLAGPDHEDALKILVSPRL
jgi:(R,R)-butanediol dehydrogenase / meso-butanediol dehydrogenase / diacetyl reductase